MKIGLILPATIKPDFGHKLKVVPHKGERVFYKEKLYKVRGVIYSLDEDVIKILLDATREVTDLYDDIK